MISSISLPKNMNFRLNSKRPINFYLEEKKSNNRIYTLINESLINKNDLICDWKIHNTPFQSTYQYAVSIIGFIDEMTYIWTEERGEKDLIAIFDSLHSGANYFVWMMSSGKYAIDWSKHLDMLEEPSLVRKLIDKLK